MSDLDDLSPEEMEALADSLSDEYDLDDRATAAAAASGFIVDWRALSDGEARAAWLDLRDWVEWFTLRYNISTNAVPNCWWKHGRLVEELSALRAAHKVLFSPDDTGLGPIGWHERLVPAIARIGVASSGLSCTPVHTDAKPIRNWANATPPNEWDAWTTQSHGG